MVGGSLKFVYYYRHNRTEKLLPMPMASYECPSNIPPIVIYPFLQPNAPTNECSNHNSLSYPPGVKQHILFMFRLTTSKSSTIIVSVSHECGFVEFILAASDPSPSAAQEQVNHLLAPHSLGVDVLIWNMRYIALSF